MLVEFKTIPTKLISKNIRQSNYSKFVELCIHISRSNSITITIYYMRSQSHRQIFCNLIQLNIILSLAINLSIIINHMSCGNNNRNITFMQLTCVQSRILNDFAFCQVDKHIAPISDN